MRVRKFTMIVTTAAVAVALVGCSGGGSNPGATTSATRPATGTSPTKPTTRPSAAPATPAAAEETPIATTPSGTIDPETDTPQPTGSASDDVTAVTNGGAGSGAPQPPSSLESTLAAGLSTPQTEVPGDVAGGNQNSTPHVVATVPPVTPAPGRTPTTDPLDIAPPNVPGDQFQLIIDASAASDGIQSTREVHVGDTFRVGIVIANTPGYANNGGGGIASLNFELDYDKTKIVAPTISGGPSVDRNPDLNVAALGGTAANWFCLPAPEGDLDDPGGIAGDGDPATGQAFLSCFTPGTGRAFGTIVLAVVTFEAIAPGTVNLTLTNTAIGNPDASVFAQCDGDQAIPCGDATITVD